jgi:hypothetical protein
MLGGLLAFKHLLQPLADLGRGATREYEQHDLWVSGNGGLAEVSGGMRE